jgi:hypothetical protein
MKTIALIKGRNAMKLKVQKDSRRGIMNIQTEFDSSHS